MSETPPPYPPPGQQPGYQPGPPPGQQPHQYPLGHFPAPASSKATTSLVLGIVSLVMCGFLLGIPAMIVARQAKREIRESHGQLGGEGLATAGFVTGLIGTLWSVIGGLLVVGLIAFGVIYANDLAESCTTVSDDQGNYQLECS